MSYISRRCRDTLLDQTEILSFHFSFNPEIWKIFQMIPISVKIWKLSSTKRCLHDFNEHINA